MICPEVDNFSCNTKYHSRVRRGRTGDKDYKQELRSQVERAGPVESVTVTLPSVDNREALNIISNVLQQDTQHYHVLDFTPAILFNKEFQHNFIKSGSLTIINRDTGHSFVEQKISLHQKTLNLSIQSREINLYDSCFYQQLLVNEIYF